MKTYTFTKFTFKFPYGADCLGYRIDQDQIICDTEKKARRIIRRAYGPVAAVLLKSEEVKMDLPEGSPRKGGRVSILFDSSKKKTEEDQDLNLLVDDETEDKAVVAEIVNVEIV